MSFPFSAFSTGPKPPHNKHDDDESRGRPANEAAAAAAALRGHGSAHLVGHFLQFRVLYLVHYVKAPQLSDWDYSTLMLNGPGTDCTRWPAGPPAAIPPHPPPVKQARR